jgi:hypothetical protein
VTIKPFYKNKGDNFNPKNYRPITIVNCFGKLFTAVLNARLSVFSDEMLLINENQCDFDLDTQQLNVCLYFILFLKF